jgi:hypothetical protein
MAGNRAVVQQIQCPAVDVQRFCGIFHPKEPHNYERTANMGEFSSEAIPNAEAATEVFQRDFLCAKLNGPGQETDLTPSMPLFGHNKVVTVERTCTENECTIKVQTVPGKHLLQGTATHTISVVPSSAGKNTISWTVRGEGPPEGESVLRRGIQYVGQNAAWSWQRTVFGSELHKEEDKLT